MKPTIRTKSSRVEVPYSDITYIEYVKLTDGKHVDDIIGESEVIKYI